MVPPAAATPQNARDRLADQLRPAVTAPNNGIRSMVQSWFDRYGFYYQDGASAQTRHLIFEASADHCRIKGQPLLSSRHGKSIVAQKTLAIETDTADEKAFETRFTFCGFDNIFVHRVRIFGSRLPPLDWERLLAGESLPQTQKQDNELFRSTRLTSNASWAPAEIYHTRYNKEQTGFAEKAQLWIAGTHVFYQYRHFKDNKTSYHYQMPQLAPFGLHLLEKLPLSHVPGQPCRGKKVFFSWTQRGLNISVDDINFQHGMSFPTFERLCLEGESERVGQSLRNFVQSGVIQVAAPQPPPESDTGGGTSSGNKVLIREVEDLIDDVDAGDFREALKFLTPFLEAIINGDIEDNR